MLPTSYFKCTISILPSLQTIFEGEDDLTPIELLEKGLLENKDFFVEHRNKYFKILFRNLITKDSVLLGGKIATHKLKNITEDTGTSLEDIKVDDYPNVFFVWDRKSQIIYIDKTIKYKIGIVISSFVKILEKIFKSILNNKYIIKVKVLPIKGQFWETIKFSKNLYSIKFELLSPNIGGRTQKEIRELLKKRKEINNATGTNEEIYNDDGNLKISPEEEEYDARVKTAERTGGTWIIKNEKGIIKSTDKHRTVDLSELEQSLPEGTLNTVEIKLSE